MTIDAINFNAPRIATFTVNVQVLRIGERQVTQSVFRQLPEDSFVDDEMHARGIAWGQVNYHWGTCLATNHIHVVWQLADRLFRQTIEQNRSVFLSEADDMWSESDDLCYAGLFAKILIDPTCIAENSETRLCTKDGWSVRGVNYETRDKIGKLLRPVEPDDPVWAIGDRERAREFLLAAMKNNGGTAECLTPEGVAKIQSRILSLREDSKRIRTEWKKHWAEMNALPQLFIAV